MVNASRAWKYFHTQCMTLLKWQTKVSMGFFAQPLSCCAPHEGGWAKNPYLYFGSEMVYHRHQGSFWP